MDRLTTIFSSIRSASKAHRRHAVVPATRLSYLVLEKFYKDGLIHGYTIHPGLRLKISLKYNRFGVGLLRNLKKISNSSNRVYLSYSQLSRFYKQNAYVLISTSYGLLTLKDIRFKNLRIGGELVGIFSV
jgi:ribosomal protein S8